MELRYFANAVAGFNTLAEPNDVIPNSPSYGLERLVDEIVEVCDRAYGRFAETLGQVVALEDAASD